MALQVPLMLLTPHLEQYPSRYRSPVEHYHAVGANNVPDSHMCSAAAASNQSAPVPHVDEIDWDAVPRESKKEGSDWLMISNPKTEQVLDVSPVCTLRHKEFAS